MDLADFQKALDAHQVNKIEQDKFQLIVSLLTEIRDLLKKDATEDVKDDNIKP